MPLKRFRWIDWNLDHATKHGCRIDEIESVVCNARHGFQRKSSKDKWTVIGCGMGGRMIEVIYLVDEDDTLFVIHAIPLTLRRRRG